MLQKKRAKNDFTSSFPRVLYFLFSKASFTIRFTFNIYNIIIWLLLARNFQQFVLYFFFFTNLRLYLQSPTRLETFFKLARNLPVG